jgi:hypothetical protein
VFKITAQAEPITSMSLYLTGTPVNGRKLLIRIRDKGVSQTIAWGAAFMSSGIAQLLTQTVAGKHHSIAFIYDAAKISWLRWPPIHSASRGSYQGSGVVGLHACDLWFPWFMRRWRPRSGLKAGFRRC